jgi:BCD family chlorophyll transporter-like MFS transporter
MTPAPLGWLGIVRLGLVQTALGAVVVLMTSTLNRIMVVELALAAMVPGALVTLHYAIQFLRPRLGYGSDMSGRVTPWILGGMAVLALGGLAAAVATAWMHTSPASGLILAVLAFAAIGLGVGASGTSLLVLLAKRVEPRRRAAAATIVWLMMIVGFIVTAAVAGQLLDPYSPERLIAVSAGVCATALLVSALAVWGVEHPGGAAPDEPRGPGIPFRQALAEVWSEAPARRFAIFVFVSMLAYSAQDLILEPFAGLVFGMTPGQSTQLSSVQHSGVLLGMIVVAIAGSAWGRGRLGSLRFWTIAGCLASAVMLALLTLAGITGPAWPLRPTVFAMGVANGAFAVAAIGSMMGLAGAGKERREGLRMGLFGAAQAIAFAAGGFAGTAAVDAARALLGSPATAYASVFAIQAGLYVLSALLAARVEAASAAVARPAAPAPADRFVPRSVARGGA